MLEHKDQQSLMPNEVLAEIGFILIYIEVHLKLSKLSPHSKSVC